MDISIIIEGLRIAGIVGGAIKTTLDLGKAYRDHKADKAKKEEEARKAKEADEKGEAL